MKRQIKNKVLQVILSVSMGSLLLLSAACIVSLFAMNSLILPLSENLGETAATESRVALESEVNDEILGFATAGAAMTDGQFTAIESKVKMIAEEAGNILSRRNDYRPRHIDFLKPEEEGTDTPYLRVAKGLSPAAIGSELGLMANIARLLRETTYNDDNIMNSYIGMDSGYTIMVNKNPIVGRSYDYDPRTRPWYLGAVKNDGIFWTDPYMDFQGRDRLISCAMPFYDRSGGGKKLRGVACIDLTLGSVNRIVNFMKIGEEGYAFLLNGQGKVIIYPKEEHLSVTDEGSVIGADYLHAENPGLQLLAQRMIGRERGIMELEMDGERVVAAYSPLRKVPWSFGTAVPYSEVIGPVQRMQNSILALTNDVDMKVHRIIFIVLFIVLFIVIIAAGATVLIARGLANSITAPIRKLSDSAKIIGGGNLEHQLEVKTGDEIEDLAETFNRMILNIKTITAEKQRINSELTVAAEIQNDMLPRIFPKFTGNKRVALFAKMAPAKEVGGDFFDFFYLDETETKLAFVIADVSGKGVPAALFMVIAKTLIKQHLLRYGDPAMALNNVNKILCEDNPRSTFVTTFIASLDLNAGWMIYANGGHNPPLISLGGAPYTFMKLKRGVPLGMLETSAYITCTERLQAGDKLYLYTDGVNEAMNPAGEQWGNERFLQTANKYRELPPEKFDEVIRCEIAAFAQGEEQSDDITTMGLVYTGNQETRGPEKKAGDIDFNREITLAAGVEELDALLEWVERLLEANSCPGRISKQIAVVSEEIFVNIASYAYPDEKGVAVIRAQADSDEFALQFEDSGVPFNPLEYKKPQPAEGIAGLSVGGRGIELARKWMDTLSYKREGDKNILTLTKQLTD